MWGLLLGSSVILGGLSCIIVAVLLARFFLKRRMGDMSGLAWTFVVFFVLDAFGHWAVIIPKPAAILAFAVCGVGKMALLPIVYVLLREVAPFPMPGELGTPEGRATLLRIASDYAPRGSDVDRGPGERWPSGS